jgi:putative transposase
MSAKGDCYDNASMESFFATIKKKLIYRKRFKTRAKARLEIVDYVETWYNSHRIHSSLGDLSPVEFEQSTIHQYRNWWLRA